MTGGNNGPRFYVVMSTGLTEAFGVVDVGRWPVSVLCDGMERAEAYALAKELNDGPRTRCRTDDVEE